MLGLPGISMAGQRAISSARIRAETPEETEVIEEAVPIIDQEIDQETKEEIVITLKIEEKKALQAASTATVAL
jgi:hypothetical protein